ncbi:MAG TPA: DUF423 domain-containing protein [Flavobacteriales bacterium]|jgi:uncharacterized membrane protein YgdD (TMEM256/DUF423 family)|nr:DUF423 domain-containing protein [Flavobacteriales bacterium]
MHRGSIAWAAMVLFLAVAAGAFGAHGLRGRLSPEALVQWHTAVEYQFYHGLAMLAVVLLSGTIKDLPVKGIARLFLVGILLFSGSIYLLSTRTLHGWEHAGKVLGPITPIGGLLFLVGWAWLTWSALRPPDAR